MFPLVFSLSLSPCKHQALKMCGIAATKPDFPTDFLSSFKSITHLTICTLHVCRWYKSSALILALLGNLRKTEENVLIVSI